MNVNYIRMYVSRMYVYLCIHACKYVCMYVCLYMYVLYANIYACQLTCISGKFGGRKEKAERKL